jgi:hypothetical protein
MPNVNCQGAVNVLAPSLHYLSHPNGPVRLMQFSHDSPGLRAYRQQTAEAIVNTLEMAGILVYSGLSDVLEHLSTLGYVITRPEPAQTNTEA